MTARGGGRALNLRRWPRSSQQYRPTTIIAEHAIGVLTTAAGHPLPTTVHSAPRSVLTTAGADARAAAVKVVSFSVLTTAAAYVTAAGVAPIDHPVSVLTTGGVSSDTGLGTAVLLDENGNPVLDEFGNPILITVWGIVKSSINSALVTGAAFVGTNTVPLLNIAVSVLTTFAGHSASVTSHGVNYSVTTTAGAHTHVQVTRAVNLAASTTAAADSRAGVVHNLPTGAQTTAGASNAAGVTHVTPTGSQTSGGAFSGAGVSHNISVSVSTTAGVMVITLLEAPNAKNVEVSTTLGASSQAPTLKTATPLSSVTVAADASAEVLREAITQILTTAGVFTSGGELTHDIDVGSLVTAAAQSFTAPGHDVSVGSVTFAAANTALVDLLHEAFVDNVLTTGAAHAEFSENILALCVDIFILSDTVTIGVEADAVAIEVEACDED